MQLSFFILFLQFKAYFLEFDANPNGWLVISNYESVGFRVRFGHFREQIGPWNGPERAPRNPQFTFLYEFRSESVIFVTFIVLESLFS